MGFADPDLEEGESPLQTLTCPAPPPSLASVSSLAEWGYEYLLGKVVPRIKGEDSHRLRATTPSGLALGNLLGRFLCVCVCVLCFFIFYFFSFILLVGG